MSSNNGVANTANCEFLRPVVRLEVLGWYQQVCCLVFNSFFSTLLLQVSPALSLQQPIKFRWIFTVEVRIAFHCSQFCHQTEFTESSSDYPMMSAQLPKQNSWPSRQFVENVNPDTEMKNNVTSSNTLSGSVTYCFHGPPEHQLRSAPFCSSCRQNSASSTKRRIAWGQTRTSTDLVVFTIQFSGFHIQNGWSKSRHQLATPRFSYSVCI